jgi:hypothetical protein
MNTNSWNDFVPVSPNQIVHLVTEMHTEIFAVIAPRMESNVEFKTTHGNRLHPNADMKIQHRHGDILGSNAKQAKKYFKCTV